MSMVLVDGEIVPGDLVQTPRRGTVPPGYGRVFSIRGERACVEVPRHGSAVLVWFPLAELRRTQWRSEVQP